MRILITAGGTREHIDPVRFISNASSGTMGNVLAGAALKAGHKVTLITTVEHPKFKAQKLKLKIVTVETSAQMFAEVKKHFLKCDCLVMAAAVADYTPARPAKTKIKKGNKPLTIKLKPTVDILTWAGRHKSKARDAGHGPRVVVGFALEDKNLRQNAEKKFRGKNLDMIVVNRSAAIGAEKTTVQVKTNRSPWLKFVRMRKTTLARRLIRQVEILFERTGTTHPLINKHNQRDY